MAQSSLEQLLREVMVRVEGGAKPGTGFFVAPGVVLTCVHVAGRAGRPLSVRAGVSAPPVPVRRVRLLCDGGRPIPNLAEDYPDIALLTVEIRGHPCPALDGDWPQYGDDFQIYGFPAEGGSVVQTAAKLSYRGIKGEKPTEFLDLASDTVKAGMSGAAVLNLRSGGVCGVVVATRNTASPDGGLAVPWWAIAGGLEEDFAANRRFHAQDHRWAFARRPPRRQVRCRLPRLVGHFWGRTAELEALERAFSGSQREVVTQSILGLGGVGKTQLAARYLWRHVEEYHVVAWVRADDSAADLSELALQLGVPVEGLTPEDRAAAALRWLEGSDERWLLVVDNVTSPDQLNAYPTTGDGRVLATSRNRDLAQLGPVLALDVFDDDVGAEYLVERTGRPTERTEARRLSQALGGLPLALSHAGAYCSAGTSFEQYIELLGDLPAAEMFETSPEVSYSKTVASTWQVSMDAAAGQAALARVVLAMAAYLAPDKIPVVLFEILVDDKTDARQKRMLIDSHQALHRYSIVELQDAAMSVHRLLQRTVRDDAERRGDLAGSQGALSALDAAFPGDTSLPSSWPQCEQLLPHVLAIGETIVAPPAHAAPDLIELLNRAGRYLLSAGQRTRAVDTAQKTAELAQRLLPEHPETMTAQIQLAAAYQWAGRTGDALPLAERVLDHCHAVLGDEHPVTLASRAQLALSYQWAGRTDEALELGDQVVADRARILGKDHPDTLAAQIELSWSYWSAGRFEESITMKRQVLAKHERLLGPNHPATLWDRATLAISLRSAGNLSEAIAILERTADDRERLLGPEHPDTLWTKANLGKTYELDNRTSDAIPLLSRVLPACTRILGSGHHDTLSLRSYLASAYRAAGRIDEAIDLYEQVVADRQRIMGPDHPDTLTARADLASSYQSAGRTSDAIAIFEQVVTDFERVLGTDHPDTLTYRSALARLRNDSP